jgi:hypothetical protein
MKEREKGRKERVCVLDCTDERDIEHNANRH